MRLGTLLLTGALALPAQVPGSLPWNAVSALPWLAAEGAPALVPPAPPPTQSLRPLTVRLSPDGALRVTDDQGLLRLRMGLPGRPLRAWRDWGTPVADLLAPMAFPAHTPLMRGLGNLPISERDFRPALEGLLWLLDDDEKRITLIHPATSQVAFLPLPGGQRLTLVFHPDHLEAMEGPAAGAPSREGARWSLPWLALLPQFIHLGLEGPTQRPTGTALAPFPKE